MFEARCDKTILFVALDDGGTELSREKRVLAERFVDSSPSRVASETKHRRKYPIDSVRIDLARRHLTHFFNKPRIPRAGRRKL